MAGQIRPSSLVFSSWGLREGLIYRSLSTAERRRDPALAGIAEFTASMGSPCALAATVAGWTAPANPPGLREREDLRLVATMLALASLQLEPNLRAEHATDWALRKRWVGIDHEERAMLAATVLANSGRAVAAMELGRLAPAESLRQAAIWGQAIRLCRRLTGGSAPALAASRLGVTGDCLELSVRQPLATLFTDSIGKDLRALARMLGLNPVFKAVPEGAEFCENEPHPDPLPAAKASAL